MADSTISGLSAATVADRTMEVPVNKGGGENAKVTLEQIVNLVSDTISNVLSVAQNAGGGSVTSNQVSAPPGVSARNSAAASIQGLTSIVNALSGRISDVEAHASTASAAATSVDARLNTLSNNVCVLSNVVSNEISARAASIQTLSTAVTSVDARVNTVSNIVSQNTVSITTISNLLSGLSARSVGVSTKGAQSAINALSNTVSDALSHAAAASAAATSVLNYVCAVSAKNTAAASVKGLQSIINAFSNRISAGGGGGLNSTQVSDMIGSVNGANYSCRAFSSGGSATTSVKGLQSVINRLSNTFSNAFSAGSAVSCRSIDPAGSATASVKGGIQLVVNQLSNTLSLMHGQTRLITTTVAASVNGTLTDINGTTVSVVAGSYYEYRAKLQIAMSAANAVGIGLTFPGSKDGGTAGIMMGIGSVGASAWQSTIGNVQIMAFDDDGSGSIIMSLVKGQTSASPVHIDATFAVSTSGNIVVQYRASVSTSNVKINPGSHVRLFKLG